MLEMLQTFNINLTCRSQKHGHMLSYRDAILNLGGWENLYSNN